MRRLGAFLLGMLFGMILLVGLVALGVYIAVAVVKPNEVIPEASTYLGELGNMSILDMVNTLKDTYMQNINMQDEDGNYYSFGQFFSQYGIDPNAAFGINFPQEVLDIPMFEFFAEGGVNRALGQIKVSAVPAIVNMFDANGFLTEDTVNELSKYTILDLISEDKGVSYVFANVNLVNVLPSAFPAEESDNKIMWAVGQASIGKLVAALSGSDSLFMQLKPNGALEALGTVPITDLLGGSEGILATILGDTSVAGLVSDSGAIEIDGLFNSLYLGDLLNYERKEENPEGFESLLLDADKNIEVLCKAVGTSTLYAKTYENKLYEAELTCIEEGESHTHTTDCYGYCWYVSVSANERANGVIGALPDMQLASLLDGAANTIMDKVKNLTLGDIMNGEITGIMAGFKDMTIYELMNGGIDGMYLGTFLSYTRTDADAPATYTTLGENERFVANVDGKTLLSDDGTTWYLGHLTCDNDEPDHTHGASCYGYIWMEGESPAAGFLAKLANNRISELGNMDQTIQSFTLADVLGAENLTGLLAELGDVKIKDISAELQNIYVGTAMSYFRKEVATDAFAAVEGVDNVMQNGTQYARFDGKAWYLAELDCVNTDPSHAHNEACFGYLWYTDKDCTTPVAGVQKAFVNAQINNMDSTINNLTLGKLSISGNNILDSIQDVPLNDIGTEISSLKLGVVLGYHLDTDGTTWLDANDEEVKGLNAKMSGMTVNELGSGNGLTGIVTDLTIGDLIDSGMMSLTSEDQYKLDIIYCTDDDTTILHQEVTVSTPYGNYTEHVDKSIQCRLPEFLQYKASNPSATATEFYNLFDCHRTSDDCRGKWKNMKLADFISSLLGAVN